MTDARATARSGRRRIPHGAAFWIVATTFLLVMAYSTVPTPLYPLYQQLDHFPVFVITLVFAAYAVGVVLSLFFLGHVSDGVGRRRMLILAVLVSALSAVMFLLWTDVPGLLAARVVNGVSVGILTATATAHLGELRAEARPTEDGIVAASVAGAANLGGLALGPLVGGLFAEFLPDPLTLPHAVFLAVLIVCAIAVSAVPETVDLPAAARAYRPQRLSAPAASRAAFVAAGFGAFAGFAVFGLFTSLAPTILAGTFGVPDHLLAGATVFAVFAAAAIGQVLLAGRTRRTQLTVATACCASGLTGIAVGAVGALLPLFVVGGVLAGVGVGVLFTSAIATAASISEPTRRGETLALVFLIAYCGLALPAIAIGVVLTFAPQTLVLLVFAAFTLVATVSASLVMRRETTRA